jgi:peptide/nickel transport system ATP-binding protein
VTDRTVTTEPLIKVEGLSKRFPVSRGMFRKPVDFIHAVDDIDFEIARGESLGLVGESGCGKSTTGRMLVKLMEASGGRILMNDNGEPVDVAHIGRSEMKAYRKKVQMIFQDPYESMNPRRTVYDTVAEPLTVQGVGTVPEREERVAELLRLGRHHATGGISLPVSPRAVGRSAPAGGRGAGARPRPHFVVADEPTSMLDVSIRISIMELMLKLADELDVSYLYITHDLAVARYMCDRIAVMYLGKIVEIGDTEEILANPLHPYTRALLSAVPVPDPSYKRPEVQIKGGITKAINPPPLCRFIERCPFATEVCHGSDHPPLEDKGSGHFVACHLVQKGAA